MRWRRNRASLSGCPASLWLRRRSGQSACRSSRRRPPSDGPIRLGAPLRRPSQTRTVRDRVYDAIRAADNRLHPASMSEPTPVNSSAPAPDTADEAAPPAGPSRWALGAPELPEAREMLERQPGRRRHARRRSAAARHAASPPRASTAPPPQPPRNVPARQGARTGAARINTTAPVSHAARRCGTVAPAGRRRGS